MPHRFVQRARNLSLLITMILVAGLCQGCASFSLDLDLGEQGRRTIDHDQWRALAAKYPDDMRPDAPEDIESISLERVLLSVGVPSVEKITVDGQELFWREVYQDAWLRRDGRLVLNGEVIKTKRASILLPWEATRSTHTIADVAPTISAAWGLRAPEGAEGEALAEYHASHVYVVSIDGLGRRYAVRAGREVSLQFISALGEPLVAQVDHGAVGTAGLGSLLSGVLATDGAQDVPETLLDVLDQDGRRAVLVTAGPCTGDLIDLGVSCVEDADGDGDVTPEILAEAAVRSQDQDVALTWIGLPGLYEIAQEYGLLSSETLAAAYEMDYQLEQLIMSLPGDSLVLIMGSHGMHAEGDTVSSGSMMPEDMYVPIWVIQR